MVHGLKGRKQGFLYNFEFFQCKVYIVKLMFSNLIINYPVNYFLNIFPAVNIFNISSYCCFNRINYHEKTCFLGIRKRPGITELFSGDTLVSLLLSLPVKIGKTGFAMMFRYKIYYSPG